MADYANAARKIIPNMPAGGGGAIFAIVGLAAGGYGLYNSVVTGSWHHSNKGHFGLSTHLFGLFLMPWQLLLHAVQPGHLGVIYNRIGGLDDKSNLREGLNLLVPWFQRPVIFDIRTRPQVNQYHVFVCRVAPFFAAADCNNISTK